MYKPMLPALFLVSFLVCLTHCASVAKFSRCDNLRSTIQNTTVPDSPIDGSHLKVCPAGQDGRTCCSPGLEEQLSLKARQDFKLRLAQHTSGLEDTMTQSADQIHDQIKQMIIKSRNKTLTVFSDAYESIVIETSDLIHRFYSNIIDFIALDSPGRPEDSSNKVVNLETDGINIDSNSKVDANLIDDLSKVDTINIDNGKIEVLSKNLNSFFNNLFPIVYKNIILNNRASMFNPDYNECLINLINNINPYNNINKLITKELIKNVKSIKILFNSIYYGMSKVHQMNDLINSNLNKDCVNLLTRMNYCHRCSDFDSSGTAIPRTVQPCGSYCVNVLNACLIANMNDVNLSWNSYLQSIVTFVQAIQYGQSNVNIEDVLYSLHSRISETIMYVMQEASNIEKKVRYACGPAKYTAESTAVGSQEDAAAANLTTPAPAPSKSLRTAIWHDLDDYSLKFNEKLTEFSESIERYKSFYVNLSEQLCEPGETACWNGQTVGTYTKSKAAPGISSQKYNPEMTWSPVLGSDPKMAQIVDGLRHTRQIVLSQLSFSSEPESYVLPEEEGSGGGSRPSGQREKDYAPPRSDDEEEDGEGEWKEGGSGSGDGDDLRPRILEEPKSGIDLTNPTITDNAGGNSTQSNKNAATSSLDTNRHSLLFIAVTILTLRYFSWQ